MPNADPQTECKYGHSMADAVVFVYKSGPRRGVISRTCRMCKRLYDRKWYYKARENGARQHGRNRGVESTSPEAKARTRSRHRLIWNINAGKIVPPKECEQCGVATRLHGHHYDGYGDNWAKVRWLCRDCHGLAHRKYALVGDRVVLKSDAR